MSVDDSLLQRLLYQLQAVDDSSSTAVSTVSDVWKTPRDRVSSKGRRGVGTNQLGPGIEAGSLSPSGCLTSTPLIAASHSESSSRVHAAGWRAGRRVARVHLEPTICQLYEYSRDSLEESSATQRPGFGADTLQELTEKERFFAALEAGRQTPVEYAALIQQLTMSSTAPVWLGDSQMRDLHGQQSTPLTVSLSSVGKSEDVEDTERATSPTPVVPITGGPGPRPKTRPTSIKLPIPARRLIGSGSQAQSVSPSASKGDGSHARELKLIEEVSRWQEMWQSEKEHRERVERALATQEKESCQREELARLDHWDEMLWLKKELFALSRKVRKQGAAGKPPGDHLTAEEREQLEKNFEVQEKLLEGYQKENEQLFSEVQRTQKELKSLKGTWIEETQCLRAEPANERAKTERQLRQPAHPTPLVEPPPSSRLREQVSALEEQLRRTEEDARKKASKAETLEQTVSAYKCAVRKLSQERDGLRKELAGKADGDKVDKLAERQAIYEAQIAEMCSEIKRLKKPQQKQLAIAEVTNQDYQPTEGTAGVESAEMLRGQEELLQLKREYQQMRRERDALFREVGQLHSQLSARETAYDPSASESTSAEELEKLELEKPTREENALEQLQSGHLEAVRSRAMEEDKRKKGDATGTAVGKSQRWMGRASHFLGWQKDILLYFYEEYDMKCTNSRLRERMEQAATEAQTSVERVKNFIKNENRRRRRALEKTTT